MDFPILFMPKVVQAICMILPFRLCVDLPLRLYIGDIGVREGFITLLIQIIWIIILLYFGRYMMKKVSKRVIVQGG